MQRPASARVLTLSLCIALMATEVLAAKRDRKSVV